NVRLMRPVCDAVSPAANCVEIANAVEPPPDVGETTSHGVVDVAVDVTGPAPLCVRRTVCGDVWALNAAPVVTAADVSDLLPSEISCGSVTLTVPDARLMPARLVAVTEQE